MTPMFPDPADDGPPTFTDSEVDFIIQAVREKQERDAQAVLDRVQALAGLRFDASSKQKDVQ